MPKENRKPGEGLVFAVCFCVGSQVKLGGPSIEPDPWRHPNCPQCGHPGKLVSGLGALSREIMLFAIDKCIWWPNHVFTRPNSTEAAVATADEILIHLRAGRERVAEGGPFDSYSTVM